MSHTTQSLNNMSGFQRKNLPPTSYNSITANFITSGNNSTSSNININISDNINQIDFGLHQYVSSDCDEPLSSLKHSVFED